MVQKPYNKNMTRHPEAPKTRRKYNPIVICVCEHCGQLFGRKLAEVKRNKTKRVYCGQFCYRQYQKANCKDKAAQSRRQARKIAKSHINNPVCRCGKTHGLHVHHINGNPLNNKLQNLSFLCKFCHMLYHSLIMTGYVAFAVAAIG